MDEKHMRELSLNKYADAKAEEKKRRDGIHTCHDQCERIACVQRREIAELKRKYAWLIRHSWMCSAISKAKAAQLLGCFLVDFDEKIAQAIEEIE